MTGNQANDGIDAAELRAALLPWRTDPELFAAGVRQRIEQAELSCHSATDSAQLSLDNSDWLQTAAAIIPVSLIGKGASGGLVKIAQLSVGQKLIAWIALPATGLLLMAAASIWALIKIRRAGRDQPIDGDVDATRLNSALAQWWRQFGLVIVSMSIIMLLLMVTGYALPVFIIFLASGVTMVSLIGRLGRAGVLDRRTIAGALAPGMMILVQITQTSTMFSRGYPFLDQMLIPAVLILGGLAMTNVCDWQAAPGGRAMRWLLSLALLAMAGWFSSSLWNPVTTRDLKSHVEAFNYARFSSASWEQWQVPAAWLRDAQVQVDLSKPRALLQAELDSDKPNVWVLCHALEAGLLQAADLDRVRELDGVRQHIFDEYNRGQPFTSMGYGPRIIIPTLVMLGLLSDSDRDFLAERLTATMERLKTQSTVNILEELLAVTRLAKVIDRPMDIALDRDIVHQALVSHQCLSHRLGTRSGGFMKAKTLNFSDQYATEAAIELMQIYGVPSAIRLDALRSYLRPSSNDKWLGLSGPAYVRAASLHRLESLLGVESIGWLDFFRHEQNLMMAVLFTFVCVGATLSVPNLHGSQIGQVSRRTPLSA